MSVPLATVDDVEAAWRPLTEEERARAGALIARASRKIRQRWPDVDSRLVSGDLDTSTVADVVAEMVQTAMSSPLSGVESVSEQAGPFAQSVRYANPAGRLYVTDEMARVFDPMPARMRLGWLG